MTTAAIICLSLPVLPAMGLGFILGIARGEDRGYELGYRDGSFDERTKAGR